MENAKPLPAMSQRGKSSRRGSNAADSAGVVSAYSVSAARDDDSAAMAFIRTVVWLCTTIAFLPLMKLLLGAVDCTRHEDGAWTWDRDSSSDYNHMTADELAATPVLYAGDHVCFGALHTPM